MKNFRFEMTKVYSEIPPPPVGLESGRSYVETKSVSPVDTISFKTAESMGLSQLHILISSASLGGQTNVLCGYFTAIAVYMYRRFLRRHW